MTDYPNKVIEVCDQAYQKIYANYNDQQQKKILVSHFGEFSQELVNSLTNNVEEMMFEAGDKKGTVKRMFSILVEGLQNIRIHGEKDAEGFQASFLIVAQGEDVYNITIGNLLKNSRKGFIDEKIAEINKRDSAEVKELYMNVLTNGVISNKGGAGLGFITMAMKSKNRLGYSIERIDDELSCFSVEITLKRKK